MIDRVDIYASLLRDEPDLVAKMPEKVEELLECVDEVNRAEMDLHETHEALDGSYGRAEAWAAAASQHGEASLRYAKVLRELGLTFRQRLEPKH